ncbi:hypothetical protein U27_02881 [Candidatus Vecturithrix granuli]|uniref:Uncharacterized protein n=1 Tax=Vecturithrix granuli TaxID=1499967 RepID=A0A081BUB5_VECG1|nr:hypothetical protein U27_02881 [Candidatus Vecturithrix granuli]
MLHTHHAHDFRPGRTTDTSPPFQRWGRHDSALSPGGTTDGKTQSSLRDALSRDLPSPPLKRWAILTCPSGTKNVNLLRMGWTLRCPDGETTCPIYFLHFPCVYAHGAVHLPCLIWLNNQVNNAGSSYTRQFRSCPLLSLKYQLVRHVLQ